MNDERDPLLQSLFAQADQPLPDEHFSADVMSRIEKRGRMVVLGRFGIIAVLVLFELLLSAPLQNTVGALIDVLSTSLIKLDSEWLSVVVAPLNSIAGLIGMMLLGFQGLYRRMAR